MNITDIQRIWIDGNAIRIETKDGEKGCEYIADYPRLRDADPATVEEYTVSFYGIHWPELDEDLSFDGFFAKTNLMV